MRGALSTGTVSQRPIVASAARFCLVSSLVLGGAVGCSSMKPADVNAAVKPVTAPTHARVGNTYLLRGFIGIFSTGIDNLGTSISNSGVRATVFQDDQWARLAADIRRKYRDVPNHEPIVLVGHSYGADDVIRIAREVNRDGIQVDLLVTIDAVTPPQIPGNVKRCVNLYQSNGAWDALPWLRGVPVEKQPGTATWLANYNIRTDRKDLFEPGTDHFNIEKKAKIHAEVIRHVLAACPTREQWALRYTAPQPTVHLAKVEPARSEPPKLLSNSARPAAPAPTKLEFDPAREGQPDQP
jgi:pimeloyl-ACP methyl ester carboxylesterase